MPGPVNNNPQVHNTHCTPACGPNDKTPPPTPQVRQAIAFEHAADGARLVTTTGGGNSAGRRDPAYFELGNVEAGTTIEMVNLSADPEASFEKNKVALTVTGRDIKGQRAGIYLTKEQMDGINLKPGDMVQLRAVDPSGNPSESVTTELLANEWANGRNRVQERVDNSWVTSRGGSVNFLDGENQTKAKLLKSVQDNRPPLFKEASLRLDTESSADGKTTGVRLRGERAIEPNSRVEIFNSRTGKLVTAQVGENQKLDVALPGLAEGDTLILSPFDNNGLAGKQEELTYSAKCAGGKAPKIGILAARLTGVIK